MAIIILPDGTPVDDSAQTPSASDFAAWQNQRRQLGDALGNSNAQSEFNRGQTLANQGYEQGNLATQWDRMRQKLPGTFARRGLLNSGVFGGALQQYGQDRTSAEGGLALKYQNSLGQIGLDQQRAQGTYTSGMSQVDTSEQARRQDLAAQLRGV